MSCFIHLQIYKGLDIITNKVTEEEQRECVHHLISYLDADHKHYNVVDFQDAAVPIVSFFFCVAYLYLVIIITQ